MKQTKTFALALASLSIFGFGVGISGQAQAATENAPRTCVVYDFDTSGCKKGDVVLYMPSQWGNEQLPVEFAGKKCDMTKQVVWTNGGVTCVYAGPKTIVDGAQEVQKMSYAKLFKQVSSNPQGWTKFVLDSGAVTYWRVVSVGKSGAFKEGDRVKVTDIECVHNLNGDEHRNKDNPNTSFIDSISKSYFAMRMNVPYGSKFEAVSEWNHHFYTYEKAGSQPKKNSNPKTKS